MIPLLAATLLHSSYQGALIAILAALVADALHEAPAVQRLRVYGLALAGLVAAPALTFVALASAPPSVQPGLPAQPWWTTAVVVAWLAGIALSAGRASIEAARVEWLRHRSIAAPPNWSKRFSELAAELGVRGRVALRLVADVHSPMAVGVVRRAVFIPAGLLAKLPAAQIEALLAHELVHVRRLDPLGALAQLAVETVLFYHPATWWLSARIREERELVCDAEVAARFGPLPYAHALTAAASSRIPALASGARSGSLLDRIERIVGVAAKRQRPRWIAPAMAALGGFWFAAGTWAVADPTDEPVGLVPDASALPTTFAWPEPVHLPLTSPEAPPAVEEAAPEPVLVATNEPAPSMVRPTEQATPAEPRLDAAPCVGLSADPLELQVCGTPDEIDAVMAWSPRLPALAAEVTAAMELHRERADGWALRGHVVQPLEPFAFHGLRRGAAMEKQLRAYERQVESYITALGASLPALPDERLPGASPWACSEMYAILRTDPYALPGHCRPQLLLDPESVEIPSTASTSTPTSTSAETQTRTATARASAAIKVRPTLPPKARRPTP